jgi:hypothetical protein
MRTQPLAPTFNPIGIVKYPTFAPTSISALFLR